MGVSSWTITVAVEGVKATYSVNAFMAFHWGSCLFTLDKEANLFSRSAFLLFSFTGKFFLFYFAILLMSLSQLKLLVRDAIFYALFKLFLAFLVQHCNTPVHSLCVLVSRLLSVTVFFPSVITKSQGEIYVLSLDKILFALF